MLDFPQWTKDNFPGVTRLDIFSGLFGDTADETMYMTATDGGEAGFNPMSPSGRKWLDQLASVLVNTGARVQHLSNNAPVGLADFGSSEANARRKGAVAMGKRWLEGCAVLGVKSMRMNSPRALGPQIRPNATANGGDGYPRNPDIVRLMDAAIESYKEMADFGGNLGIKVTFENHWGLAADPMNLRIIIDTINHPVLRRHAGLLQLGARVPALQRPEGAGALLVVERPREILGSLGRQERRAAVGSHHARGRIQGHVRARVRSRPAERRRGRQVSLQGSAGSADGADAGHVERRTPANDSAVRGVGSHFPLGRQSAL